MYCDVHCTSLCAGSCRLWECWSLCTAVLIGSWIFLPRSKLREWLVCCVQCSSHRYVAVMSGLVLPWPWNEFWYPQSPKLLQNCPAQSALVLPCLVVLFHWLTEIDVWDFAYLEQYCSLQLRRQMLIQASNSEVHYHVVRIVARLFQQSLFVWFDAVQYWQSGLVVSDSKCPSDIQTKREKIWQPLQTLVFNLGSEHLSRRVSHYEVSRYETSSSGFWVQVQAKTCHRGVGHVQHQWITRIKQMLSVHNTATSNSPLMIAGFAYTSQTPLITSGHIHSYGWMQILTEVMSQGTNSGHVLRLIQHLQWAGWYSYCITTYRLDRLRTLQQPLSAMTGTSWTFKDNTNTHINQTSTSTWSASTSTSTWAWNVTDAQETVEQTDMNAETWWLI